LKILTFDAVEHRHAFAQDGLVHLGGGAAPEFCQYVQDRIAEQAADRALQGSGIRGAKDQFLLEFPPGFDYTTGLFDSIATLCNLDRSNMTLSERHVKCYQHDANPLPRPHKDRFASQVAVGVSVAVSEGSHIVLYPDHDRAANPLLRAGMIEELLPEEQPEVTLREAQEITIFDQPGDVQVFRGAQMWHLRRNAAGTVIVYFKFNDYGCDPLGEDPHSQSVRETTLSLLASPELLGCSTLSLSRRFESVTREYHRGASQEWLYANVWEQPTRRISEFEGALLRSIKGPTPVPVLLGAFPSANADLAQAALRRLATIEVLDLALGDGATR
jgi:hypothetical protein